MARHLGTYLGEPVPATGRQPAGHPVPAPTPVAPTDTEFEVEGCSGCDRLIATTVKCCCCGRAICRDCARVNGGVVWCETCHDDSWDLCPDEQGH